MRSVLLGAQGSGSEPSATFSEIKKTLASVEDMVLKLVPSPNIRRGFVVTKWGTEPSPSGSHQSLVHHPAADENTKA